MSILNVVKFTLVYMYSIDGSPAVNQTACDFAFRYMCIYEH